LVKWWNADTPNQRGEGYGNTAVLMWTSSCKVKTCLNHTCPFKYPSKEASMSYMNRSLVAFIRKRKMYRNNILASQPVTSNVKWLFLTKGHA